MKKIYFQPAIEVKEFIAEDILCASSKLFDQFDMGDAIAVGVESNVDSWQSFSESGSGNIQVVGN